MSILPVFVSHYSYGTSILTLDEPGKAKPGGTVSVFDLAVEGGLKQVVLTDERMDGFFDAYKASVKAAIPLVFGLKLVICADMTDKTPASDITESKVIVFARDSAAYRDLLKISNRAWSVGRHGSYGRLDWRTLKEMWTERLVLALPFWSSFLQRNMLTFSQIVPDLPAIPWVLKEVDSQLPFAPLIEKAIDQFAASSECHIQEVKTIYYRDSAAFKDYQIFRARSTRSKGKSGTYSAPGVDNLSSDRFSYMAWRELVS